MKLFIRPKGFLSYPYGNNSSWRPFTHTGIDFVNKFRSPVLAMRDGYVYKVREGSENLQDYRNVHQICETPFGPMEVAYVHLLNIYVHEGDDAPAGLALGSEGNTGSEVFVNGIKVQAWEKLTGKGAHTHISVRPLERVRRKVSGQHYLRDIKNRHYKDAESNYYRIRNNDNGTRGWVDFSIWMYTPTRSQVIVNISKILGYLRNKIEQVNNERKEEV